MAVNAPPLGISVDGFTAASLKSVLGRAGASLVIALAQGKSYLGKSYLGKFYLLYSFLFGYSGFLDAGLARLRALPISLAALFVQQGAMAFSAFCLGLVAARPRLLADPQQRRTLLRRMALIGLAVGLPVQVAGGAMALSGPGTSTSPKTVAALGTVLVFATAPILTVGSLGLHGLRVGP